MKKNKNYVLYEYKRIYTEEDYRWHKLELTKCNLIRKIAILEIYNKSESILSNLVSDISINLEDLDYKYFLDDNLYRRKLYAIYKKKKMELIPVDITKFYEEIEEEKKKILKVIERNKKLFQKRKKELNRYEYRKDPVPHVEGYRVHRGEFYRHPKTTSSKRNFEFKDELFKLSDAKIKNLPTLYDDLYRHNDKSWKTSFKVKKQWEKHLNRHCDSEKFDKRELKENFEENAFDEFDF